MGVPWLTGVLSIPKLSVRAPAFSGVLREVNTPHHLFAVEAKFARVAPNSILVLHRLLSPEASEVLKAWIRVAVLGLAKLAILWLWLHKQSLSKLLFHRICHSYLRGTSDT